MARTIKYKIINPVTMETEPTFFENGVECKKIEIDTAKNPIAKQYTAYILIHKDVKLLIEWTKKLKKIPERKEWGKIEMNDTIEYFPILVSLVIIYGRIFSSNKSRGTSLKKNHIDPKYHKIHDELIHFRDNFIAHSSAQELESARAYVVLNPNNENQFTIGEYWTSIHGSGGTSSFPGEVHEHLENFLITVENKLQELSGKLTEMHQQKKLVLKINNK